MGLFRKRTRAQNDREITSKQDGFLGGMNLDNPSSEIDETEVVLLDNLIPYRSYLKSRSGTKHYGALPSSDKLHQLYEHTGNLKFVVHCGAELYYSEDNMQNWVLIGGELPDDTDSDMKAIGDDVVLFQEDKVLRIEMTNSSGVIARPINADNPTVAPTFTDTIDASLASRLYRYTYTYARIVDDLLVAESGSMEPEEAFDPDYVEVYTDFAISANQYPVIDVLTLPAQGYWTDIRLYRTLDIFPSTTNVNSSEIFYLVDTIPWGEVEGIDEGVDFDYIIDDTIPDDDPGQPDPLLEVGVGDSYATPDQTLLAGGEILLTRFFAPIPNGIVNEVTPGFMFVANRDAKIINYSSLGDVPRRVGYYQPAFQFASLDDSVRIILGNPDSIIICCNKSTYRGTIFTERNVGNTSVGEVIAQLEPFTVIDSDLGVYDYGSVAKMDTGRFIAHCSDSSIRTWEGRKWGIDLSRFKVQSEIKTITEGSVGVYNSDGYYLLWYSSDKSSLVRDKCLRYGLAEDVGKGWCFFSGDGFPFPEANIGAISVIDPVEKKQLTLCYNQFSGTITQVETFDGPVGSGYSRFSLDLAEGIIKAKVIFRELTGNLESYFCIHQQSNIYVRPITRDTQLSDNFGIDVKIGTDGIENIDSAISVSATGDAFFFKESAKITGHRLQISVESNDNSEGFILRGYDTRYRVQDRRDLNFVSSENTWQKELSDLTTGGSPNITGIWFTRPYQSVNRIDAEALDTISGSYTLASSPDSRVNALAPTTDYKAASKHQVIDSRNGAISLWLGGVQTPGGKVLDNADVVSVLDVINSQEVEIYGYTFNSGGAWTLSDETMLHFYIYSIDGVLYLAVNGVLSGSVAWAGLSLVGVINIFGGATKIFDLRSYGTPPSIEAIRYYVDDILTNQGGITLPMG